MSYDNIFDKIQSRYEEKLEISAETILSEATQSKLKNRKANLFQKIMSIRNKFINSNNINNDKNINKIEKKLNLRKILESVKNTNDKINIINNIFINNISSAKEIISKYINTFNYNEQDLNPESEKYTNYLLDFIEENQDLAKNNIILNNKNIHCLISRINLMSEEKINYDYNYIMLSVYFSILDENVNKLFRQQINHQNLIQLIIKHETCLSYIYLFYIYGFIYYLSNQEIEQYEGILDSIIGALINKKECKNDKLLWEMYNLLTYFSSNKKFVEKIYNNYQYIFCRRNFYEKDSITIEKLKIINNIFSNMDNKQIFAFLTKEKDLTLNMILYWLKFLSNENNIIKIKDDNNKLKLISLTLKIIIIITSYQDLTFAFLENKKCLNLIIICLNNFLKINISNQQSMLYFNQNNNHNISLVDIENIFLDIANNIIINNHNEFASIFYKNKIHLLLGNCLECYSKNNFIFNELLFNNILKLISALFEYEKKLNSNTMIIKNELDNNNFYNNILKIKENNANFPNLNNKCNDFIGIYYNDNSFNDINMDNN